MISLFIEICTTTFIKMLYEPHFKTIRVNFFDFGNVLV